MNLDKRKSLGIAAILAMLVAATHGHHFASALHLPPATWAAFMLAGFYLPRAWLFVALIAEVVLLDFLAVTGGVSAFCFSPAYGFLLPAYGALWLTGRWYATRYRFSWNTLPTLAASLLAGAALAELFSSGGFYFFSGRFTEPSLSEFSGRLLAYFPDSLQSLAFWMVLALSAHVALHVVRGSKNSLPLA